MEFTEEKFEMVAKTMQGLEEVLAEELRNLGAEKVEPGRRMVSFEGDKEMLYKANLCCRTALRILKPIYKFVAADPDEMYEQVKEFDWGSLLTVDSTFCIDTVAYSDEFTNSQYATYRVKDGIVDWFRDRYGEDKRPGIRTQNADLQFNVHISGEDVTISLDSSGESLHKRGYRVAQTDAPINEVLAAGIILRSGWRGESPLVDPMCGSGTFLIEAALIAANINPGIYRNGFAFEKWADYDADLFDRLYNDDSNEREFNFNIYGSDINRNAIAIAEQNIKSAGVSKYIDLQQRALSQWTEAPEGGVMVTNPPYGERLKYDELLGIYEQLGSKLKQVFTGYHAWIISSSRDGFEAMHLSPSTKIPMLNGSLECELREYIMFEGDYRTFRKQGGRIHFGDDEEEGGERPERFERRRRFDDEDRRDKRGRKEGFHGDRKFDKSDRKFDKPRRKPAHDRDDSTGESFGQWNKAAGRDRTERREGGFRGDRKGGFKGDRKDGFKGGFRGDRKGGFRDGGRGFERGEGEKYVRPHLRPEDFENPLAARRNPNALKSLTNKQPELPRETPNIRHRKGWKPSEGDTKPEE